MNAHPTAADDLLGVFFPESEGLPNAALAPWIERLRSGEATLLPVRSEDDVRLYAINPSQRAARGFSEELLAAIGPSWSDFTGAPADLDPAHRHEAAILAYNKETRGGPSYRLAVHDVKETWAAMQRMTVGWERRPDCLEASLTPPPLEDLLRDIELALQASALDEAQRLIALLRRRGELSSQNLLFLELRLLAASGAWGEVIQHPLLDDVLSSHRPTGVSSMLFEAVDEWFVDRFVKSSDPEGALQVFGERVADRFRLLFESAGQDLTRSALRVTALAAVTRGASREDVFLNRRAGCRAG